MGLSIFKPAWLLGMLVLGVLILAGCAAPASPPRWSQAPTPMSETPDGSRLVIPSELVAADRALGSGFEGSRLDERLSVGLLEGDLAVPHYAGESAPSLDDARSLYLRTDPGRVLYFSDRRGWRSRHWHYR